MAELSPMMQQYMEIKERYKDYILFFRLGDFYEMFFEDAKLASDKLDLTLTGKDCGQEERAPMCGVPYHSCEGYISRLIQKGYKVAICEQTEDPANAKGLVKRDVVRVITPGTVTQGSMLDESKNNFISSIYIADDNKNAGISFADISTGEIYGVVISNEERLSQRVLNEIGKFAPRELVINPAVLDYKDIAAFAKDRLVCTLTLKEEQDYNNQKFIDILKKQFRKQELSEINITDDNLVMSLGVLFEYLYETQKTDLSYINNFNFLDSQQFMELDISTRRNLELCETMRSGEKKGSLLWVLDKTKTAMGSRLLRSSIEQPLCSFSLINRRLEGVDELRRNNKTRSVITNCLKNVNDLERLMTRIVYSTANARDFISLKNTLGVLPKIRDELCDKTSRELTDIRQVFDNDLGDVVALIQNAIVDEPPFSVREGGFIREGYNEELDELQSAQSRGTEWMRELEARERENTGIKNLKTGYNRIFGYYIEVTKLNQDKVPDHYIRKQTLTNCERYITDELKQLEEKILSAKEKSVALEYEIFMQMSKYISEKLDIIQNTARNIAMIDMLVSFANVASENNYVAPQITYGNEIDIKSGRHPVVEKMLSDSLFVPNDTYLDCKNDKISVITGPNMAGKSTYMRQVAIITLMAQIGSFVPAKSAKIGIVDKIFTRVGASDDLASGQSTFMVEMSEVAYILNNATNKSLIIMDEIGRGTSTFDGMSIARAVIEYIVKTEKHGAKTLFATHYHELCDMEEKFDNIKNYNIAVKKRGDDIIFLRKIVRGGVDDSYGIEVAKLAGVPNKVIKRAKEILEKIEKSNPASGNNNRGDGNADYHEQIKTPDDGDFQISFGNVIAQELFEDIKKINLDTITPIEAMNTLYKLKQKTQSEE